MDEQILFDRFHEALDKEPRPGAYERMRFAMTSHPVALRRRPAFRMRWSKMGLRIAAVVTVAVIATALIAVLLVSHRPPVGSVPAAADPNVEAYQVLISSDYNKMASSTSNHCDTIQDTDCAAAVVPVVAALDKWVADLSSFPTPSRYAALDTQLRRHLSAAAAELNAAVAFQKANNQAGFDLAMNAALFERAWVDPTSSEIEGTYPTVAGSYHDAIRLAKLSLDACINGTPAPNDLACTALSSAQTCTSASAPNCESVVQGAAADVQTFLIGLVQNPAPSALTTKAAKLQTDLAAADTALLAITDALLHGDSAKAGAGRSAYTLAISAADDDASIAAF